MENVNLSGRTVVVTGANSGIGRETALEMAKKGARVILACRNEAKAAVARDAIIQESGNHDVVVRKLDLASFRSVRECAEQINQEEARLDILVNNAGLLTKRRQLTEDGHESTIQSNHLGHFLLTLLLWDKIKVSAPARIVNVSSVAHKFGGKVDFADLALERNWSFQKAYGISKTMNILFTVELARLLQGTGVTAYSLHPGVVKTNILNDVNPCIKNVIVPCLSCCSGKRMVGPEEGAATTLYCALHPEVQEESGRYYKNCKVAQAKSYATDPEITRQLWLESARMCGIEQHESL